MTDAAEPAAEKSFALYQEFIAGDRTKPRLTA